MIYADHHSVRWTLRHDLIPRCGQLGLYCPLTICEGDHSSRMPAAAYAGAPILSICDVLVLPVVGVKIDLKLDQCPSGQSSRSQINDRGLRVALFHQPSLTGLSIPALPMRAKRPPQSPRPARCTMQCNFRLRPSTRRQCCSDCVTAPRCAERVARPAQPGTIDLPAACSWIRVSREFGPQCAPFHPPVRQRMARSRLTVTACEYGPIFAGAQ